MDQPRPQLEDQRSQLEVDLTNKLVHALTDLNLSRIAKPYHASPEHKISKREDYLYVCISGFPTLDKQFDDLGIPGEIVRVYCEGFDPRVSKEEQRDRVELAKIQKQGERLHQMLKDRLNKPIVFIFHSFGTYLVSYLLKAFHLTYQGKVKGIVAIGPHPITATPGLRFNIQYAQQCKIQDYIPKADEFYEQHKIVFGNLGFNKFFPNKYSVVAGEIAVGHGYGAAQGLRLNRMWPRDILKCFIWGRQENRIDEPYINQMAIYYCHKRPLDEQLNRKVSDVLKRRGASTQHPQQRFLYDLEGGKHSVHKQRKTQATVVRILEEYLSVLQELD